MCTDVVSVNISVINKCTATHTMYITAGMKFAVSCTHDHKHPLHSNTYTCHTHMYLVPSEHNPLQLSQQSLLPRSEGSLL